MYEQTEELATEIVSMKSVLPSVAETERDAFIETLAALENRLAAIALESELSLTGE